MMEVLTLPIGKTATRLTTFACPYRNWARSRSGIAHRREG